MLYTPSSQHDINLVVVVSVPTRYPEELEKLIKEYSKDKTKNILDKSREALRWLMQQLEKLHS